MDTTEVPNRQKVPGQAARLAPGGRHDLRANGILRPCQTRGIAFAIPLRAHAEQAGLLDPNRPRLGKSKGRVLGERQTSPSDLLRKVLGQGKPFDGILSRNAAPAPATPAAAATTNDT